MPADGVPENPQHLQKTTIDKCTAEVEKYRRSQLAEDEVINAVSEIIYLDGPPAGIEITKCREACKNYIGIIRSITRDMERRAPNASDENRDGANVPDDDNDAERDLPAGNGRDRARNTLTTDEDAVRRENERRLRLRRTRDDLEDDGADDDERPSKRNFDEELLPFVSSSSFTSRLPAALVQANKLKANYRADLATSLLRLHDAVDLPQFPRALWKELLQGYYIDFDKLASTVRSLTGDATESKKLGDFEIHSDSIKITRRVTDKLEWSEAYGMYAEAVKFAFPCRERELIGYASHIAKLFSGTAYRFHGAILDYDRAVRTRTGRSNNFLLTDTAEFDDLAKAHMSPIGAAAHSIFGLPARPASLPKAPRFPTPASSSDYCHRFNAGKKHDDRCPYKHGCHFCGSAEHGAHICPRRTGNPSG
ncbi:uncharacterized protein STEHIDRAFT_154281 [Stereum hirsutum FP-91666 SS1]|uniref:uncharacterized protein n=1 Tax=Stereum hirsutum (strain FP-91666) TaxID=721885 RepID=UPI000440C08F|nr:uncharacterized protein STEHIDRAFT_154281 [Stereum hirsutum FP-91666 SS1]EIM90457.1 hypothetical protein STEHIDRAFT_154281 [Stereum hirsutum FP-91666 SS1]